MAERLRDRRRHGVIGHVPIEALHRPGLNESPDRSHGLAAGIGYGPASTEAAIPVTDQYRAHLLARAIANAPSEPGKRVPFSAGRIVPQPVWSRYHVQYYRFALLFLAFDMEMAFMYPWAVVYRDLGLTALLDMIVFLSILFLGLLYGWRMGALRRQ